MMLSSRTINSDWNVYINNIPIEKVNSFKFFGINIDNKFSFIPHLKELRNKLARLAGVSNALGKFFNMSAAISF
jgi:hypothetical protein